MRYSLWRLPVLCLFTATLADGAGLTWDEIRERFKKNNPNLLAGEIQIRENKAVEVTAGLRPNPTFTSVEDQNNFFSANPYRPFAAIQWTQSVSYLIERRNKRPLRVKSAELATAQTKTDIEDLERQLTFALRDSFVRALQAKAVLQLAQENLAYYDKVIAVYRERQKAGDISRVDLARVELQRVQFESDLVNAGVNVRTAKIALLALVNDRQSADTFDVAGAFEFKPLLMPLAEARAAAADSRPDVRSLLTASAKAKADNELAWANGSTDPTAGVDYTRAGPTNTMGFSVSLPLRVFDKNQGEKERTRLEIERVDKTREALIATVYRDVDSAYASIEGAAKLLIPYRESYLGQSADIRDTVSFAYSNGGASLLEFLDAQKSYRDTQLNYRNLVGAYLSALNQLSLAVGREVNP